MNELQIVTLAMLPTALVILVGIWVIGNPLLGAAAFSLWIGAAIYAWLRKEEPISN